MPFGFKGGIHPDDKKAATAHRLIEELAAPKFVVLPMLMHSGVACNPLVNEGERVLLGQRIAESSDPDSAPIHASVSGRVVAIEPRIHPNGESVMSVVIENDFEDEEVTTDKTSDMRFADISIDILSEICDNAGIVELDRYEMPMKKKLLEAKGKARTLIINGAESEPYITAENRLILEQSEDILAGASAIMKALGLRRVHIGIASNKKGAVLKLKKAAEKMAHVRIHVLRTKYPQGDERQLVKTITGREIPPSGSVIDSGIVIVNIATCVAIARAAEHGEALIKKVVTVSGSAIANPKNLLCRIGTPIEDLINGAGGLLDVPKKIIIGGPMTGMAQSSTDVPIIKSTNAVLAFRGYESREDAEKVCIRCGKCVFACPMHLQPIFLNMFAEKGLYDELEANNISDCTGCGSCSYVCPARIELTEVFAKAKDHLKGKGVLEDE